MHQEVKARGTCNKILRKYCEQKEQRICLTQYRGIFLTQKKVSTFAHKVYVCNLVL